MSADKTGGPAFPVQQENSWTQSGMTLRDYFAVKVMQAMCEGATLSSDEPQYIASRSYVMADAMLKARGAQQ